MFINTLLPSVGGGVVSNVAFFTILSPVLAEGVWGNGWVGLVEMSVRRLFHYVAVWGWRRVVILWVASGVFFGIGGVGVFVMHFWCGFCGGFCNAYLNFGGSSVVVLTQL